jgi:hypothetical protein
MYVQSSIWPSSMATSYKVCTQNVHTIQTVQLPSVVVQNMRIGTAHVRSFTIVGVYTIGSVRYVQQHL